MASKIKPRTDKPPKLKSVSYYKKGSLSLSSARKPKKPKKYKAKYYGSQQLKKTEAWKVFSQFIRRSAEWCFTCGARKRWQELDAGHFIAGNVCGKNLFFNPLNVRPQCTACNRFKHGNGSQYALALTREHGADILEHIDKIRREEKEKGIICRFSKEELKAIEEKYTNLLASL